MSQISGEPNAGMQQIDLMKLNLPQLTQLKTQLENELTLFQDSLQTLKMAKQKFGASKESLEQFKPDWSERPVLVPLSSSMYVPGKYQTDGTNNVIIDVGTGYYVEQDLDSAKDYFKRKIDYVAEQIEKVEILGFEKSKIRDAICDVIEIKIEQLKSKPETS